MSECNNSTIDPYIPNEQMPWDEKRIKHLFNRIGYGATKATIDQAVKLDPTNMIESLLDEAYQKPLLPIPVWYDWTYSQFDPENPFGHFYDLYVEWTINWINDTIKDPVREKIVLFWSNHFVTRFESYGIAPWLVQYHHILQKNALGNFKTFVSEVGLSYAMLAFLNGVENNQYEPNENYARELYELFTLGLDNGYTEQDIRETARAFTGYNHWDWENMKIHFVDWGYDKGEKTIFGKTDIFDYHGVIDWLFETKSDLIAQFICRKIYAHFVSYDISENIVNQLAQTLLDNDFELLPVFKQLFTSTHFFDETEISTSIKSHIDYFLGLSTQFDMQFDRDFGGGIMWYCSTLGQSFFDPVDVAGWKGNKAWIDSGALLTRWLYSSWFFWTMVNLDENKMVNYLKDLTNNSNDVNYIVRTLADQFLVKGLHTESDYDKLLTAFKADIPENYFENYEWNLDWDKGLITWQCALLFEELKKIPEITMQ